MTPPFDKPVA